MLAERKSYSSTVQIRLEVAGRVLHVAQVGENSLILREPCQLPKSLGKIVITVDGEETEYPVFLHRGISPETKEVRFRDFDQADNQQLLFDDNSVPF
jgi:hypothetical protein